MRLQADIEIERPASEVFEFIANFENNPAWQGGMKSAQFTTPPPHSKGSQYEQVASFLGRPVITRFEVTDLQPGRSITIDSIESTFPIHVTRQVEPLDPGRTRVRATIDGGPEGLMRLFAPLIGWFAQRSVTADYRRLKAHLEHPAGR